MDKSLHYIHRIFWNNARLQLLNPRKRIYVLGGLALGWGFFLAGGAQWVNSGEQAQIKEFTELTSQNANILF